MAVNAGITLEVTPLDLIVPLSPDAILQTLTNLLSNAIKFSEAGDTVWLTAEVMDRDARRTPGEWTRDQIPGPGSRVSVPQHQTSSSIQIPLPSPLSTSPTSPTLQETPHISANHPPNLPATPYLLLAVTDEGRGIPVEKLNIIFDRFQQVDTSDSRQKGGTGLGLSICKNIVERHGGTIWVASTEGQGSTFYFTLPIHTVSPGQG
jgi:signal transduction histidine kinase